MVEQKLMKFVTNVMPRVTNEDINFNYLRSEVSTREWLKFFSCNGENANAHANLRIRNLA
jgi:hypothetical protein